MQRPPVSVVVATHGRARLLPRLVAALEVQGIPDLEVVVIDDASPDDTTGVLQKLAATTGVRLSWQRLPQNSGPATARNAGWRAACGDVIAFTDDDCTPQPGWLAGLLEQIGAADVVQGRTEPDPAQLSAVGPFSRTLEVTREDGYYQTCNIAYRRAWLERLGGFNERFRHPTGEDTDLAWRAREAGARTAFADAALVLHDVRPSRFRTHLLDTWRWEGVVLAVREHPGLRRQLHSRWFWKAAHPPALLALAGVALAAVSLPPVLRWVGALLWLPYADLRLRRLPLRGTRIRQRVPLLPLVFVADAAEVGVCAVASVRYRCLLL